MLYQLFLGTRNSKENIKPEFRRAPACTRLRLKLFTYLIRSREASMHFPACIQVSFKTIPTSFVLFDSIFRCSWHSKVFLGKIPTRNWRWWRCNSFTKWFPSQLRNKIAPNGDCWCCFFFFFVFQLPRVTSVPDISRVDFWFNENYQWHARGQQILFFSRSIAFIIATFFFFFLGIQTAWIGFSCPGQTWSETSWSCDQRYGNHPDAL